MRIPRRQRGFWHLIGAAIAFLALLDVAITLIEWVRSFRRRRHAAPDGTGRAEPPSDYLRRIAPGIIVLLLGFILYGLFQRFGPLKPVHEWFQ
ncbi:MAG: hypothetical protein U1F35_08110 [Steroidobacteraceae bacterium]